MLGAEVQFVRSRGGDDWFYGPMKGRRSHRKNQDSFRRARSDVSANLSLSAKENHLALPECKGDPPEKPVTVAASSPSCNLKSFLESISPSVPAQYFYKTTVTNWGTCDVKFLPYFVLGDLWESFKEWSVYGAGVPLLLNDSDYVVQYYVPYLSGIQLYVDSSKSCVKPRRPGDDSDSDRLRDSWSEGSCNCEHERGLNYLREQPIRQHQSKMSYGTDALSLRDELALQEELSSDDNESNNSSGCLLFEYLEKEPPYSRPPFADKIDDLSRHFPELNTLKSCDLLPSSWISVAWYPIYRIPTGTTLRDLDACFLTFHYLHTQKEGCKSLHGPFVTHSSEVSGVPKISLPVFALASYKFKTSMWIPKGECNQQSLHSLLKAANDWLSLLRVNHPDFLFFCRG